MEFNEKLQELRKQRGLTQEELAEILYVSRAAVSKWESGRGMPSIDSLKAISKFFSVTLDDLLSGEELLVLAEDDHKQKERHIRDMMYGLLDCGMALLFFLPFFGQVEESGIREVSLLALDGVQPWLRGAYMGLTSAMVLLGLLMLAMQNFDHSLWTKNKTALSLGLHGGLTFLFILSRQPYAGGYAFLFLAIKALLLLKKP